MTPTAYPLMMTDEGARVPVVGLMGGHRLERRMTEMGLNLGAELVVRHHQGGGAVVMRGESRFALGGNILSGWSFLDPVMGIVGAILVSRWAIGLARDSAGVLLDAENHVHVAHEIEEIITALPDHEIADLHLWRIGPASRACIVSLVTHAPHALESHRQRLAGIHGLDHFTIEVNHCRECFHRTEGFSCAVTPVLTYITVNHLDSRRSEPR